MDPLHELIWPWFRAFCFTQLIEVPIYGKLLGIRPSIAFGASMLTHPYVWFVFPPLVFGWGGNYVVMCVVAEVFAWLGETAYFAHYFGVPIKRAAVGSLVANGTSFGLGLLLRHVFHAPI